MTFAPLLARRIAAEKAPELSNKEKLEEIKKQVTGTPAESKPMTVDQTETSAEEVAAADELKDNQ